MTILTGQEEVVVPFHGGRRELAAAGTNSTRVDLYWGGDCAAGMLVQVGATLLIDTGTSTSQAVRIGAYGAFEVGTSATLPGGLVVLMSSTPAPSELTVSVKSLLGHFKVIGPVVLEGSATGDNVVTFFGEFTFEGGCLGAVCPADCVSSASTCITHPHALPLLPLTCTRGMLPHRVTGATTAICGGGRCCGSAQAAARAHQRLPLPGRPSE